MTKKAIHVFGKFLDNGYLSFRKEQRPLSKFEAWLDILDNASSDGIIDGGLKPWQERWRWKHRMQVKRFLEELKQEKYLIEKDDGKFRIRGYPAWFGAEVTKDHKQLTIDIIMYFNFLTKRNIAVDDKRIDTITARMNEFKNTLSIDDFKLMMKHRYELWREDKKMSKHYQFETLFRKSNFKRYLEEARDDKRKTTGLLQSRTIHQ